MHTRIRDHIDLFLDKVRYNLHATDVDGLTETSAVLKSSPDGNCLFNSVSIALIGDESLAATLREATSQKLSESTDIFSSHPALISAANITRRTDDYLFPHTLARCTQAILDDTKDRNAAIEAEATRLGKDGEWASLMGMMGVAEVIKRPICSIYPNVRHNKLRDLFHQSIIPTDKVMEEPIYILWSREGGLDSDANTKFVPNHFVPVVNL